MPYTEFKKTKHYTIVELLQQYSAIKKKYSIVNYKLKRNRIEIVLFLKPTDLSIEYKIRIVARCNSKIVDVFVDDPRIIKYVNGKKTPHLYSNGSLCLYYPNYNEWDYMDLWSDTLIPWTSLWLFYYEIWKETGEWVGGGIHADEYVPMS